MTAAPAPRPFHAAILRGVPAPTAPLFTLEDLGEPAFAIFVYGTPVPQGSKAYVRHINKTNKATGKVSRIPLLKDSSDLKKDRTTGEKGRLERWRNAVASVANDALPPGWEPLDGPLVEDLVVTMPRLASTPKTLRRLPHAGEDLDKLARAVNDALGTTAAVIANDSRICAYRRLEKVFAGDPTDPDALLLPGAIIRLWRYPEHLLGKVA